MTYFLSPKITDWQRQIVLGTVLGGSSIVKPARGRNCYLFMRSMNRNWLAYKALELQSFASQRPFTEEGNTNRWHSNCFPVFNEFRELLYVGSVKTVNTEVLDKLRDIGLAVWYCDCGKLKNGKAMIHTQKFGKEGTKMIVKYFNELGIECDIYVDKKSKSHYLAMTDSGSEQFFKTVAHRMPSFMHELVQSV